MMANKSYISELEKLQKEKISHSTKKIIQSKINEDNDVNSIIKNIEIEFSDQKKYENLSCEILYEHLAIGKMLAQLALNSFKPNYDKCEISFPKTNIHETYRHYYETIIKKKVAEDFLIDRISYYITIFSLLSYKEFNEKCRFCDARLSINKLECSTCDGSVEIENTKFNEKCRFCDARLSKNKLECSTCDGSVEIENTKRKSDESIDLCSYCDNKTINGICQICGGESKQLKTNCRKIKKEDRLVQIRSNSMKTLCDSKLKSHLSSQWICNVCSYNQNNSSNINCEVCMSSKFTKINSCVFDSSFERSNEIEINLVENVGNILIEYDGKPSENQDKWTCTQCTFYNKKTVDLCETCFTPNIKKIGSIYELPEETWCCKRCRENNLFECYKCKNCQLPAEFFNKWRCGQCSYYNNKVAIHCGACHIENPYLIKCNICVKSLVNKKYDKICKKCSILAEKRTNSETVDYHDDGKTLSETSEITNVSSKRSQWREKNEKQNNFMNNVSQNVETKNKDSIVGRKSNNEETGNSKIDNNVNETPPKTFKLHNSLNKGDENIGKPNEIKAKCIDRKHEFSTVNNLYSQKTNNLTIYNIVYNSQSERPVPNKSLAKGDQNCGKPNERQVNLNKDSKIIQQKPDNKDKIHPVVEAKIKMSSKLCKNCKSKQCANNQNWCIKCDFSQWYCLNKACGRINFQNEYCKQCKAENGSKFSNCNSFCVLKDKKKVQMWQCGFCMQFNTGKLKKCNSCQNLRYLSCYKKCECNWINLNFKEKCDKCSADLITNKI